MGLFGGQSKRLPRFEHGADINRNDDGNTPLHVASFMGNDALVEFLIQKGANPTAVNQDGKLPLDATSVPWNATRGIFVLLDLPIPQKTEIELGQ